MPLQIWRNLEPHTWEELVTVETCRERLTKLCMATFSNLIAQICTKRKVKLAGSGMCLLPGPPACFSSEVWQAFEPLCWAFRATVGLRLHFPSLKSLHIHKPLFIDSFFDELFGFGLLEFGDCSSLILLGAIQAGRWPLNVGEQNPGCGTDRVSLPSCTEHPACCTSGGQPGVPEHWRGPAAPQSCSSSTWPAVLLKNRSRRAANPPAPSRVTATEWLLLG